MQERFVKWTGSAQGSEVTYEIIAAGKASLDYAKGGLAEYLKRLKRYGKFELRYVKDGTSPEVSKRLLEASRGAYRIALDERGVNKSSSEFAYRMKEWTEAPQIKRVCFLIGASDGHTSALRHEVNLVLCLSTMTMQHELALVVLLEQIYRSQTILRGEPYHR